MTKPALWLVRRGVGRTYLFGEGPPRAHPLEAVDIQATAAQCDLVWKETPEFDAVEASRVILQYGIHRAASSMGRLSRIDSDRFAAAAELAAVDMAVARRLRPWAMALMLQAYFPRHGLNAAFNDAGVTAAARRAGVPISFEFTSADAAIRHFAAMTPEAELEYLRWTIGDVEAGAADWVRRGDAWAIGDLSLETASIGRMQADFPSLFATHVEARNRGWISRIEAMLDRGQVGFVMVGLGHLVGDHSLRALLAQRGANTVRVEG